MRLLRPVVFVSFLSLVSLACQSSDPSEVIAGDATSTTVVDTSVEPEVEEEGDDADPSVDGSVFESWYADVDLVWDAWTLGLNERLSVTFDQLVEGERDFIAFGALHAPTAAAARDALTSMPDPLGDSEIDDLYGELLEALESVAAANESAAEIYEDDIEEYETQWNLPEGEGSLFIERDEAEGALADACLALTEVALGRQQDPLDCFGTENVVESTSTNDFQVLQVGDELELQIGDVALTYQALVTAERADWGEDWLAVNDDPDFARTWWLGMPGGLADPAGELLFDTVIDPIPFGLDLDAWTSDIELLAVLGSGSDEIGGLSSRYWDVRIDLNALEDGDQPVVALISAETGNPVGGIQLGFEAAWRLWTIDHPAGPVLLLQAAFLDPVAMEAAFDEMTEEQLDAGEWPDFDDQLYLDAIASFEGYKEGISFNVE